MMDGDEKERMDQDLQIILQLDLAYGKSHSC